MSNQQQLVRTVRRVTPTKRRHVNPVPLPLIMSGQGAVASLAVRPSPQPVATITHETIWPAEISFHTRTARVNKQKVKIQVEATGQIPGQVFERWIGAHAGDGLFIRLWDRSLRRTCENSPTKGGLSR